MFFNGFSGSCFHYRSVDIPIVFSKIPDIVNITHGKQSSISQRRELACKEIIFLAGKHRNSKILFQLVVLSDIRHKNSYIYLNFNIMVCITIREQKKNSISFYIVILDFPIFSEYATNCFVHNLLCSVVGRKQIKVQINRESGQAIEKVGAGAALKSNERRDGSIGINIPENLSHDQLMFFFIEHAFGTPQLA